VVANDSNVSTKMKIEKKPFVKLGRDLTASKSWKSQKGVLGSVTFSDARRLINVDIDDLISKALEFALKDLRQDRRRPFSFIAVSGYYGGLWEISFLVRVQQKISAEQLESSLSGFFEQYDVRVGLREVSEPFSIAEVMRSSAELAAGWYVKKGRLVLSDDWPRSLYAGGGAEGDR
jgi:hypothetical protein